MSFDWNVKTTVPIKVLMDGEPYNLNTKTYRYSLKGNAAAINPLIVIGLNPSTADEEKPDQTMKRVVSLMEINGFDGFVMLNLYPLRTPYPKKLKSIGIDSEEHKTNLEKIDSCIKYISKPTILLAFGANIAKIKGLANCFKDIVEQCKSYNPDWCCLDKTKDGHPKHPLFLPEDLRLQDFDIDDYLRKLEELSLLQHS